MDRAAVRSPFLEMTEKIADQCTEVGRKEIPFRSRSRDKKKDRYSIGIMDLNVFFSLYMAGLCLCNIKKFKPEHDWPKFHQNKPPKILQIFLKLDRWMGQRSRSNPSLFGTNPWIIQEITWRERKTFLDWPKKISSFLLSPHISCKITVVQGVETTLWSQKWFIDSLVVRVLY